MDIIWLFVWNKATNLQLPPTASGSFSRMSWETYSGTGNLCFVLTTHVYTRTSLTCSKFDFWVFKFCFSRRIHIFTTVVTLGCNAQCPIANAWHVYVSFYFLFRNWKPVIQLEAMTRRMAMTQLVTMSAVLVVTQLGKVEGGYLYDQHSPAPLSSAASPRGICTRTWCVMNVHVLGCLV